jgi:hypothetical protein
LSARPISNPMSDASPSIWAPVRRRRPTYFHEHERADNRCYASGFVARSSAPRPGLNFIGRSGGRFAVDKAAMSSDPYGVNGEQTLGALAYKRWRHLLIPAPAGMLARAIARR